MCDIFLAYVVIMEKKKYGYKLLYTFYAKLPIFGFQHFWISISMVFLTAATIFTLLKINGKFWFSSFVLVFNGTYCNDMHSSLTIFPGLINFIQRAGDISVLGWWDLFINFGYCYICVYNDVWLLMFSILCLHLLK